MPGLCAFAQEGGRPPAKVTVAKAQAGSLSPTADFKGTVYFKEVSEVATEVSGKVTSVHFEEGDHMAKGAPLVTLDHALLDAELNAAQALVEQSQAELEQQKTRLKRSKLLLQDEVTTPQEFDDITFTVEALNHKVAQNQADVHRLQVEIRKKTTFAPYAGVVVKRNTELGEWKNNGDAIATLARDDMFDVMVNIPEEQVQWIKPDQNITMKIAGKTLEGRIVTVIPQGDVATRTFPVKIRVENQGWLLEGMSANVAMPIGPKTDCILVPRDAVLIERGQNVIYCYEDGKAGRLPVKVVGYSGLNAGLQADSLVGGTEVVTKGQERLRDGQAIEILK